MASSLEFVLHVVEQLNRLDYNVTYKKMFGEFMVYVDSKPTLLICDDTVCVKKLNCVEDLLINADVGFPYQGAKEHFILDTDDLLLTRKVIDLILPELKIPKKRVKK
ncbi:MAG: hypothetical protein RBQ97_04715 [Acholeplasma sp.]|nr:hypothetical protein [Acholeplasma sp.]